MLLLLATAHADTWFECDPVSTPADAWQYATADASDPYEDALDELEAWRDTSCVTTACAATSYYTTSCEETSCVTSAGATWYENIEVLSTGLTTTQLEVTPPTSAGLDWTWASIRVDDYVGWDEGDFDASVEWSGDLIAGWPLDSSFWSSESWIDTTYNLYEDEAWSGPTCDWSTYLESDSSEGDLWMVTVDTTQVQVEEEYYDCAMEYRIHGIVDGVEYGAVETPGWEADLADADRDGYRGDVDDCDDTDPTIYPCAPETAFDGVDSNCRGEVDRDGDGEMSHTEGGLDCDDNDATVNSSAAEIPYDGVDNDCVDGDVTDADGDGEDSTATRYGDDCDDSDPTVNTSATEIAYDGIDQDCDGIDLNDMDGDGYVGVEAGGDDCDDNYSPIHPGARDIPYDGIDQDCSGSDMTDRDEDGVDAEDVGGADCDDRDETIYVGAPEVPYDGVDQDCDGADLLDVDADGIDAIAAGGDDCDDEDATAYPGATEVECDEVDQDCDGVDACPPEPTPEEDTGTAEPDTTCGSSGGGGGALAALLGLAALVGRARPPKPGRSPVTPRSAR